MYQSSLHDVEETELPKLTDSNLDHPRADGDSQAWESWKLQRRFGAATAGVELDSGGRAADNKVMSTDTTVSSELIQRSFPDFHPYLALLPRALELSSAARVGVYDCLYIALPEREPCRVVTADQRLLNAFPDHTISLDALP